MRLNYEYQYYDVSSGIVEDTSASAFWIEGIGNVKHPIYSAVCYEPLPFCGYINLLCVEIDNDLAFFANTIHSVVPNNPCLSLIDRIYVDDDAPPNGTGESWENAFSN